VTVPTERRAAIRKPKPHPLEPPVTSDAAGPAAVEGKPQGVRRRSRTPKAITATSTGHWAQLNVRVPFDLEQRLTMAALTLTGRRQERVGKVAVVEEALSEYLDRHKL
jgi:hypothetical protein